MADQLFAASDLTAHASITVTLRPAVWERKAVTQLSAHGSATVTPRRVFLETQMPAGGLTDLGMWDVGAPDTAMTRVVGQSNPAEGPTASRVQITASAPVRYSRGGGQVLWDSAAYAAGVMTWAAMPNGYASAWQQAQMEPVPVGNRLSWDATSWEGRPCYLGRYDSTYSMVTRTEETAMSGNACGKMIFTGGPSNLWGYWMNPIAPSGMVSCVPGEYMGGSVSVKMERSAWWAAGLQFYDGDFNRVGSDWYHSGYQQHPGSGSWDTSYVSRIAAPAGAVWCGVVPHICINSAPDVFDQIAEVGETVYVDMHRVWGPAYNITSAPTAYEPPRKVTVDVKANRVNLIRNPSMTENSTGWGVIGVGDLPFPISWDGSKGRQKEGALRMSLPGNLMSYSGVEPMVAVGSITGYSVTRALGTGVKPRTYYVMSVYVRRSATCPHLYLYPDDNYSPFIGGVLSTEEAEGHPELIDGEWVRLWAMRYPGDNENGLIPFIVGMNSAEVVSDCAFWLDDALMEEGTQLREYFDGDTPGSGYLWSDTPNFSASHYYRGFKSQAYRLQNIVQAAVPHGTQVEIRYAQPPE